MMSGTDHPDDGSDSIVKYLSAEGVDTEYIDYRMHYHRIIGSDNVTEQVPT